MISSHRTLALVVLTIVLTTRIAEGVAATIEHPFHSTSTEMEWNPESARFEISLQLPGLQIDEELSRLHKRHINLETTPDAEPLLEKYIRSKFQVSASGCEQCEIHWVGVEIDARNVWAYFEVELQPSRSVTVPLTTRSIPEGLKIQCGYFLDSHDGQVNLISIIEGTRRATTQLTVLEPCCRLVSDHKLEAQASRQED